MHCPGACGATGGKSVVFPFGTVRSNRNGVVLRQPNRRYKCSRQVLLLRMRHMWLNVIRVRALAVSLFGHDLDIYGIDQKPMHMNEAGSQNCKSLEIVGAPEVASKENHSATRARFSVMTFVSNNKDVSLQPGGLPIEVCFRSKTKKMISNLPVPTGVRMSFAHADKGSYRSEHVVAFLDRWLE